MAGHSIGNTDHLIRSNLWSARIKERFDEELMGLQYVDMITDFPDGTTINIPSIGQMEVRDYDEEQEIAYTAMDTGNFTFSIDKYVSSATYITNKFRQDSFYADQLAAKFVPEQARALAVNMETNLLSKINAGQTAANNNTINGARHRMVASGTNQVITIEDFARAHYALQKAAVPMQNLVAIVDPSVAHELATQPNHINFSNNLMWDGIVGEGSMTGMKFRFNVFGFDVYASNFLPTIASETIDAVAVSNGVANYFFSAAPGATPLIGLIRQAPMVESEYNKDKQREEYVTTARWGFSLYRPENMVTILTSPAQVYA